MSANYDGRLARGHTTQPPHDGTGVQDSESGPYAQPASQGIVARHGSGRLSRVELSVLLAFESGVTTLADAARALKLTARELIEMESDAIAEGRALARELADNE